MQEHFLKGLSNHLILDFGFLNYKLKYDVYLDKYNIFGVYYNFLTTCPTRKQLKHMVLLIRICFRAWTSVATEYLLLGWFCLQQVNEI